jgi:hypothetical protein
MNKHESKSSRRAFFLQGGAALGAGVAATAASALPGKAQTLSGEPLALQQLAIAQDREAIRLLHMTFASRVENQGIDAAADLFEGQVHLKNSGASVPEPIVLQLRPNHLQHTDTLVISEDRLQASATWHTDVALGTPLQGDSTAAQMARLQGQMATLRWESGRLEAQYVKSHGQWKIASVSYSAA